MTISERKHTWLYYHVVFTRLLKDAYSEPSRISKMELFAKITSYFCRSSILDAGLGSEYASV